MCAAAARTMPDAPPRAHRRSTLARCRPSPARWSRVARTEAQPGAVSALPIHPLEPAADIASASRARYAYEKPDPAQAEDRRVFAVLGCLREFASRLVLGRRGEQRVTSVPWLGGDPR